MLFQSNLQISEGHREKGNAPVLILHGCWVYISGTKSNTLKCACGQIICTWIELVYHLECNETTPSNPLHSQSCRIILAQFAVRSNNQCNVKEVLNITDPKRLLEINAWNRWNCYAPKLYNTSKQISFVWPSLDKSSQKILSKNRGPPT